MPTDEQRAAWRASSRRRRAKSPEKARAQGRASVKTWRQRHPEKLREVNRAYYASHREEILAQTKKYEARRRLEHPEFRALHSLRSRLHAVLKRRPQAASTAKLVGCTTEDLRRHLESRFKMGMTWKNYGRKGWHIDHIRPCASFDLSDLEQQRQCFHFTNLQPLWWQENLVKSWHILK